MGGLETLILTGSVRAFAGGMLLCSNFFDFYQLCNFLNVADSYLTVGDYFIDCNVKRGNKLKLN